MSHDALNLVRQRLAALKPGKSAGVDAAKAAGIHADPDTDSNALMESVLATSSRADEAVIRVYEAFFQGVTPSMRRLQERAVDWQLADLRAHGVSLGDLPPGVQESGLFAALPLPVREGRRVTAEGLALLRMAQLAQRELRAGRAGQVVLEIGAGMGELARLLRRLEPGGPAHTHVIVDSPQALSVASLFLGLEFPGESMLWVDKPEALAGRELTDWRFIFVPVSLAGRLAGRRFDLFLYAASLAGPQSTGTTTYGRFIQETVRVDRVVALNRFFNTELTGLAPWRPAEPAGLLQYDDQWRVKAWELEPSYLRCPWMTRLYPRCVEFVAQRGEKLESGTAAGRARELVEDVKDYQWVRHVDGDDLENTIWDHAINHDGSMNGSIFKLWEAIRLSPNYENLILMIRQIDQVQRYEGKVLEETPAYESMLERLLDTPGAAPQWLEMTRKYLAQRRRGRTDVANLRRYLREVLVECRGRRMICYGAGLDLEALAKQGVFEGQNILGLIDDRRPAGTEYAGYKVVAIADLPGLKPEVILATSSRYGAILRERARGIAMALRLTVEIR